MRSLFDQTTLLKHQYFICFTDRIKAVSDHKARSALHQTLQSFLNFDLSYSVDAARRFIQHKNGRTRQDGPSNSKQLSLTLANAATPGIQHLIVTSGKPHNERVSICQP
ncbi:hypothetical protein D3C78_1184010 [compost metagenome]